MESWQQSDPTTQSTITGTPHRTGHKYAWEGKKVGVGSLTLLDENTRHIHFELEFIKPWKSKAKDNWLFEEWGNGSETKSYLAECRRTALAYGPADGPDDKQKP
ncbi:MAG: hypothetical protein IPM85_11025 [Chitinophagaceae bacterium]|nr:hypothetical protein [Chitinophagaceae bacterium]